jgi:hypothetical protein
MRSQKDLQVGQQRAGLTNQLCGLELYARKAGFGPAHRMKRDCPDIVFLNPRIFLEGC